MGKNAIFEVDAETTELHSIFTFLGMDVLGMIHREKGEVDWTLTARLRIHVDSKMRDSEDIKQVFEIHHDDPDRLLDAAIVESFSSLNVDPKNVWFRKVTTLADLTEAIESIPGMNTLKYSEEVSDGAA